MAFWLETKTEYWDALPVQYLRRTGAYGRENAALMAEMKNRITEKGLWQENTTIWAVPWDNPQTTPPHLCRYDVCTQGLLNLPDQRLPEENILFSPCPTPQKPLRRHGQAVRCCGGTGLYHRLSQTHHGTLCQKRSGQTPL